jgi:Ca2+-transporting ATPase
MLYMGTVVTYGRATAVVTATGMAGELGNIATLIQETAAEKTVLQKKLASLSLIIVFSALALICVVALEGWLLQGQSLKELFVTAVSMAVAAIPEGLPTVVTIALALGAQRMLRRRALIRKLSAVETLGSVTVICSDKTGTLTQNRMTVTVLDLLDHRLELSQEEEQSTTVDNLIATGDPTASLLLTAAALCSDAVLKEDSENFETLGDPTEGALVSAAARAGLIKSDLEDVLPRTGELPFDSERKRMSTVHSLTKLRDVGGSADLPHRTAVQLAEILTPWIKDREIDPADTQTAVFTKGAVDSLLEVCSSVWTNNQQEPLTENWQRRIEGANENLAAQGIRVLGVAVKAEGSRQSQDRWEKDLTFVGMIGMLDPLRTEVKAGSDRS